MGLSQMVEESSILDWVVPSKDPSASLISTIQKPPEPPVTHGPLNSISLPFISQTISSPPHLGPEVGLELFLGKEAEALKDKKQYFVSQAMGCYDAAPCAYAPGDLDGGNVVLTVLEAEQSEANVWLILFLVTSSWTLGGHFSSVS